MSAIAYYLELEGIATTGISLVREHTAAMRPPRFLWVPFALGRPLGAPHDSEFQHRVIRAALALLGRRAGPVLEDFDTDVEPLPVEANAWSCPVSFAPSSGSESELLREVEAELAALAPWYALARRRRGRSTVGAQPLSVPELVRCLDSFVSAGDLSAEQIPGALSSANALKAMTEDLKAYYLEAVLAQPAPDTMTADRWFWSETAASRLIRAVAARCVAHERRSLQALGKGALVPRRAS